MKMLAIRFTQVTLLLALLFTNHLVAPKASDPGLNIDKSEYGRCNVLAFIRMLMEK